MPRYSSPLLRFALASLILGAGPQGCTKSGGESSPPPAPEPVATVAARPLPVPESVPAPPDVAAPPRDAQKTASGLVTKVLTPGTGTEHPRPGDTMKIQYVGWRKDGVMFDRSGTKPVEIGFVQVFPGWAEGLQLMVPGEKRRLWIPSALAYGDAPRPGVPSGDVTMDVELLGVARPSGPSPAAAPSSIAMPL